MSAPPLDKDNEDSGNEIANGAKGIVLPVLLRGSGGSLYPRGQRSLLAAPPLDNGNENSGNEIEPRASAQDGKSRAKEELWDGDSPELVSVRLGSRMISMMNIFRRVAFKRQNTPRDINNVLNQFFLFVHFFLAC